MTSLVRNDVSRKLVPYKQTCLQYTYVGILVSSLEGFFVTFPRTSSMYFMHNVNTMILADTKRTPHKIVEQGMK